MGIGDFVILLLLAVAVGFALRAVRKGKGRCGGDCTHCGQSCQRAKTGIEEKKD